jgi:hypothetical protein
LYTGNGGSHSFIFAADRFNGTSTFASSFDTTARSTTATAAPIKTVSSASTTARHHNSPARLACRSVLDKGTQIRAEQASHTRGEDARSGIPEEDSYWDAPIAAFR